MTVSCESRNGGSAARATGNAPPEASLPRKRGEVPPAYAGGSPKTILQSPHRQPLFLHDALEAVRADAVAEPRVGVSGEVALHLLPVVLVVADFLAVRADR